MCRRCRSWSKYQQNVTIIFATTFEQTVYVILVNHPKKHSRALLQMFDFKTDSFGERISSKLFFFFF